MPNINLSDARRRDAVVKAESIGLDEPVRYLGPKGNPSYTRRVLKTTVEQDLDNLTTLFKTPENIAQAIVDSDPDVDMESSGQFLWNTSKVWLNEDEQMVFRVQQQEDIRDVEGKLVLTRDKRDDDPNVDSDIALRWTGTSMKRSEAIRRFVFSRKLQIVHINGLTYDFLYSMAKELHDTDSLMQIGAGKSGKKPLVFRRGSVPYRAFLEGRIDGKRYVLLLHLSNMELKVPAS